MGSAHGGLHLGYVVGTYSVHHHFFVILRVKRDSCNIYSRCDPSLTRPARYLYTPLRAPRAEPHQSLVDLRYIPHSDSRGQWPLCQQRPADLHPPEYVQLVRDQLAQRSPTNPPLRTSPLNHLIREGNTSQVALEEEVDTLMIRVTKYQ